MLIRREVLLRIGGIEAIQKLPHRRRGSCDGG